MRIRIENLQEGPFILGLASAPPPLRRWDTVFLPLQRHNVAPRQLIDDTAGYYHHNLRHHWTLSALTDAADDDTARSGHRQQPDDEPIEDPEEDHFGPTSF